VGDRLRPLWDFGDLDATEVRLRAALDAERSDDGRSEALAELARVEGLRGDFDAGERLVDEAAALASAGGVASARIDIERGRLRRSSGNPEAALPLFERAFATASAIGQWFIAADAAHMCALAAPDSEGFVAWTQRGIDLAETYDDAAYWAGPLLNNLGWEHYEAGELERALDAFERALRAREREPEKREPIEIARYAVGRTLRRLGRSDDAIPLLEQAVAGATDAGAPDGWFHEELALEYDVVGRDEDAREQAGLAIPLLEEADPSFADDADRSGRLRALAAPGAA
jgi:tetratricopeptide (TPR) repeat protein